MGFKGVIFDLDGVIVATDKYHYQAWKAVTNEHGIYFDEKINNRLRGVSRADSLDIILKKSSIECSSSLKTYILKEKDKIYRTLLLNLTPNDVLPEILTTLLTFKKNSVKIAIGSSSKNAGLILNQLGLKEFFDAVSDGNNIIHSKPDPEVFLNAASYINLMPHQCLVVEDALAGIDAAYAGGFKSAALGSAYLYEKADYSIKSFSELLPIVLD